MEMLDSRNILNEDIMISFLDVLDKNDLIYVELTDSNYISFYKDNLRTFLDDINIQEYMKNNDELILMSYKASLIISKNDYIWWSANTRRKNKLFKTPSSKKSTPSEYYIECGFKLDGNIKDTVEFKGSKKECIEFINSYIKKKSIDNFMKGEPLISFDLDNMNDEKWHTLEDLEKKGVIKLS